MSKAIPSHCSIIYLTSFFLISCLSACSQTGPSDQASRTQAPLNPISSDSHIIDSSAESYTSSVGFPPTQACTFLSGNPAFPKPNSYTPFFRNSKNDYACGTEYYVILPGSNVAGLDNNISYYVRGTRHSAKRVRILLNVNDKSTFNTANNVFQKAAFDLFKSAYGREMNEKISIALGTSTPGQWTVGDYVIELQKYNWPTGKGFSLNFIIRDPGYHEGM